MNLSPMILLIIAFVCVTIGYVAGALVISLQRNKTGTDPSTEVAEDARPEPEGWIEVARWVRKDSHAPIEIKYKEKYYHHASELNRRDRDDLEQTTVEWLSWLGYSPQGPSATAIADTAETAPPAAKASPAPAPVAPNNSKSIVGQIDAILQDKLAGTPYETARIHLTESTNGVMVQMGLEQYTDVNTVPDEEIRKLIRASAAEWEKRAGR